LTEAHVLINPDYSKEFLMFSFTSFDTLAIVFLQKNTEGLEHPISFFNRTLRDAEMRYDIMEKQAYALVKSLKDFRIYVLHSNIIAYVPSALVKEILIQPNIDGKRSKWIAKILEFELEIKPTKLVKGKGLARLLDESNCKALGVNFMNTHSKNQQTHIFDKDSHVDLNIVECTWYEDIIYFLQKLRPPDGLDKNKVRALKLKAIKYCLIDRVFYWKDPLGILLRFLDPQEAQRTMTDFHDRSCGGHHFWRTKAYKILRAGYFWPNIFTDICANIRACAKCQKFIGKHQLKSLPLKPIMVFGRF
jgi:hypothetical protein